MNPTTMALMAMFAALMTGAGWALALVPNLEFVTALAFLSGIRLGALRGLLTAVGGMFLFSATNPLGSGLAYPILLASQLTAMGLTGIVGGWLGRFPLEFWATAAGRATLAATGFLLTVFYDGITSLSFPLFMGAPATEIWAVLVSGLLFSLLHQGANTVIFATLVPTLIRVVQPATSESVQ